MKSSPSDSVLAEEVLSPELAQFLSYLHRQFDVSRKELLEARKTRQGQISKTGKLHFLTDHPTHLKPWKVAKCPNDLLRRRVEITGPAEPKMIINALNSEADCFMADFEDALSPTWHNILLGQKSLTEAVQGTLRLTAENGKTYQLNSKIATLLVRPRGLHLNEIHYVIDGQPASASLFDFGTYFFRQASVLLKLGKTPAFYLPKMESHLEARWWAQVFTESEKKCNIPPGSIRATMLIETLPAAFEMEEMLFELRDYASGLNAGRWDYIFSYIKKFRDHSEYMLSDRHQITMTTPFMAAYARRLVQICHRHEAHAMGGMSAFVPSRKDENVNKVAFTKVREDKEREAHLGFDGTWVAHPDLAPVARAEFDKVLGDKPHQKSKIPDGEIRAEDLLSCPPAKVTIEGFKSNIRIALLYLERWLSGQGAVALFNLMEDLATAEISRAQIWQWLHHKAVTVEGIKITRDLYLQLRAEELKSMQSKDGSLMFDRAMTILDNMVLPETFTEFIPDLAYNYLVQSEDLFKHWSLPQTKSQP